MNQHTRQPVSSRPSIPPTGLLVIAVITTQMGSAFAKALFSQVGPAGMVCLRVGLAAIALLLLWRPRWTAETQRHWWLLVRFGTALSMMNFTFYLAIERLPIGIAVAIEFLGPLGLAAAKSRRWMDGLWVALAAIGIILLTPWGGFDVDPVGILFALIAASCWAAYIMLSAQTGQALPGGQGLAWAMVVGAILLLPIGIAGAGASLLNPLFMGLGLGVALLSSVVPYSCELEALRSLPVYVVGILLSLEPVAAAVSGWIVLGEILSVRAMVAILLVAIAAAGVSRPQAS
ncbi:MAG: EamA family transporter [Cyanobacteria bacterium P01_F01_bin.150]